MRVRDLPYWLQEIAKQRTIEDKGYFTMDSTISSLFMFDRTPEGWQYWHDVANGKIPPQPNQQMAQQIIVRDTERMISIKHLKYNKDNNTFTIKQKDLQPLIRPMVSEHAIPKRMVIVNNNTGRREVFIIDITLNELVTIPNTPSKTHTIRYYNYNNATHYMLDVVIDTQDIHPNTPVISG